MYPSGSVIATAITDVTRLVLIAVTIAPSWKIERNASSVNWLGCELAPTRTARATTSTRPTIGSTVATRP